ncbi:hypothetical protein HIM_06707 [Hirsutella minnesotensis 3608]|uniref:Cell wall protein n=1 Tax=Hirsutella minnesotensis 3608 TaxID=1043627 RepID=A0A0F8A4M0_9HYPO|nr:hypothetical protein HIM_06707 [Hirsutella minnesotensis 3608]
MKLNAVISANLATCIYAQAINTREVFSRDAAGSFTELGQNVGQLDQAIKTFSGDTAPMLGAAGSVAASLQKTKADLDAAGSLGNLFAIASPLMTINTNSKAVVADLKTRKPDIEKAGACSAVRDKIGAINTNSESLMGSMVQKEPKAGKAAKYVKDMLDDIATQFSPENCKN